MCREVRSQPSARTDPDQSLTVGEESQSDHDERSGRRSEAGALVFNQACSGCHGPVAGQARRLRIEDNAADHAADHGEGHTIVEFIHEVDR